MQSGALIVGLGNPGAEYARTRHNAGYMLVECLARQWKWEWSMEKKFSARLARGQVHGRTVLLAQPVTFMNLSGEAVSAIFGFYRMALDNVLVAVDDADLPLGEIRMRPGGGSGGHHGLDSVQSDLGSAQFPRLRIGIGRRDGMREIAGHVLGSFEASETNLLGKVMERAVSQVDCWLAAGLQKAMSQFNGLADTEKNK